MKVVKATNQVAFLFCTYNLAFHKTLPEPNLILITRTLDLFTQVTEFFAPTTELFAQAFKFFWTVSHFD